MPRSDRFKGEVQRCPDRWLEVFLQLAMAYLHPTSPHSLLTGSYAGSLWVIYLSHLGPDLHLEFFPREAYTYEKTFVEKVRKDRRP